MIEQTLFNPKPPKPVAFLLEQTLSTYRDLEMQLLAFKNKHSGRLSGLQDAIDEASQLSDMACTVEACLSDLQSRSINARVGDWPDKATLDDVRHDLGHTLIHLVLLCDALDVDAVECMEVALRDYKHTVAASMEFLDQVQTT